MAGLLDFLAGSSDPSTADPTTGLVESQQRQLLYGILGQAGGALMAAGQPHFPGQNAQYLAQLGNIPGNVQQQMGQMGQLNAQNQRTIAEKRKNEQQAELMKYTQTPEFQAQFDNMPVAQRAVAMAALKAGDVGSVLKALQEAHVATQPKFNADGSIYNPATGDVVNPMTGMKYNINTIGQGGSGGGTASPGIGGPPGTVGPTGDQYLATVSQSFGNTIKGMAEGRIPLPSGYALKSSWGQAVMQGLSQYEPGFEGTRYNERLNFAKGITSGPLFQNVVAPSNKFLNHAGAYLDSYDKLGMEGGLMSYVTNPLQLAKIKAERTGEAMAAQTNLQGVKDEFAKFMAGKGQLTDLARKLETELSLSNSPEETYATIGKMAELMKGQLSPLEVEKEKVMGKAMPGSLINPEGHAVLARIEAGVPKAASAAPPAPGSTAAPAPGQPQQPAAPQGRLSPADAAKLPPGTPFIGMDGIPRVKH